MALVQCKECGKEVSDDAKACPHCGYSGIIRDKQLAQNAAFAKTKVGKFFNALLVLSLVLAVWGLYSCATNTEDKDKSYAALSETHKKLADDCMKWVGYGRGNPTITAQDNEFTKQTRIILWANVESFKRCDYKTKTGKRVEALWILDGRSVEKYHDNGIKENIN